MVRIWISRNAAEQALAVEICRGAGLDYDLRLDEGHAEAFLTGAVEAAEQALADLDAARIPVLLVEATDRIEADRLSCLTAGMDGGTVSGETAEYGRHCKLELVTEFRRAA